MPGEVTFIPNGLGVQLPADASLAEGYYAGAITKLRVSFVTNGETNPLLLMRLPTYMPTVDLSSKKERELAASVSGHHKHRLWLLRSGIDTDRTDSVQRATDDLKAWQKKTSFRTIAAPGIEVSPYNLGWTTMLLDAWGKAPDYFLFDMDLSGYDKDELWQADIDRLIRWLQAIHPMARALLCITLPRKSTARIQFCLEQMWRLALQQPLITSILCQPHIADSFLDHNLRLSKTGEIFLERSLNHGDIRKHGQGPRQTGDTA